MEIELFKIFLTGEVMKKIALFLSIVFVLAGCAENTGNINPYENSAAYLGFSTKELIRLKGAPGAVAVLPTGESVWTYKSLKTIEGAKQSSGGVSGTPVTSWVETTSFIIGSAGTVKSYSTAVENK